jgi:branched-chain amino acid aminotransferase
MPGGTVITFEARPGGALRVAAHGSLSASSAALPEGAYTTLRTYGRRRVLHLDRHLARLEQSVALQGRPGRLDAQALRSAISAALDATAFDESRLRVTFSPPRTFVAVEAFAGLPASAYENGVACVTLDLQREIPQAKDTRFIATAQRAYGHLPPGTEEGLLVAPDGSLLEGLSSNFFAVLDGTLRTEGGRVLSGVTRSVVLEVAAGVAPLDERAVGRRDVQRLSEAFVTSVSREVLPVVRIDSHEIGTGRVGPVTSAIRAAFAERVERESEPL